jgi:hypothetical protein
LPAFDLFANTTIPVEVVVEPDKRTKSKLYTTCVSCRRTYEYPGEHPGVCDGLSMSRDKIVRMAMAILRAREECNVGTAPDVIANIDITSVAEQLAELFCSQRGLLNYINAFGLIPKLHMFVGTAPDVASAIANIKQQRSVFATFIPSDFQLN